MDNSKKGAGEDVGTEEGVESRLFCASWMRFLFQIKDEVSIVRGSPAAQ